MVSEISIQTGSFVSGAMQETIHILPYHRNHFQKSKLTSLTLNARNGELMQMKER